MREEPQCNRCSVFKPDKGTSSGLDVLRSFTEASLEAFGTHDCIATGNSSVPSDHYYNQQIWISLDAETTTVSQNEGASPRPVPAPQIALRDVENVRILKPPKSRAENGISYKTSEENCDIRATLEKNTHEKICIMSQRHVGVMSPAAINRKANPHDFCNLRLEKTSNQECVNNTPNMFSSVVQPTVRDDQNALSLKYVTTPSNVYGNKRGLSLKSRERRRSNCQFQTAITRRSSIVVSSDSQNARLVSEAPRRGRQQVEESLAPSDTKSAQKTKKVLEEMDYALKDLTEKLSELFVYTPRISVFRDWRIVSLLGSGTFANVYEVQHILTGERAAAKLLSPQSFRPFTQPRIVEMFAKEIRYLVTCQCPGVVVVKKVVRGVEGWAILQQLVTGGTLWEDCTAENDMEQFILFVQLLQTVMLLQDKHVVHRDLKPTNILRDKGGSRLWLTDFGWSESTKHLNVNKHELPGTIEINPPEVLFHHGNQSKKVDNYALGMNMMLLLARQFVCRNKAELATEDAAKSILNTVSSIRAGRPLRGFSADAWDVFLGLSEFSASRRSSVFEVLESPWCVRMLCKALFSEDSLKYLDCPLNPSLKQKNRRTRVLSFLWHDAVKNFVAKLEACYLCPPRDVLAKYASYGYQEDVEAITPVPLGSHSTGYSVSYCLSCTKPPLIKTRSINEKRKCKTAFSTEHAVLKSITPETTGIMMPEVQAYKRAQLQVPSGPLIANEVLPGCETPTGYYDHPESHNADLPIREQKVTQDTFTSTQAKNLNGVLQDPLTTSTTGSSLQSLSSSPHPRSLVFMTSFIQDASSFRNQDKRQYKNEECKKSDLLNRKVTESRVADTAEETSSVKHQSLGAVPSTASRESSPCGWLATLEKALQKSKYRALRRTCHLSQGSYKPASAPHCDVHNCRYCAIAAPSPKPWEQQTKHRPSSTLMMLKHPSCDPSITPTSATHLQESQNIRTGCSLYYTSLNEGSRTAPKNRRERLSSTSPSPSLSTPRALSLVPRFSRFLHQYCRPPFSKPLFFKRRASQLSPSKNNRVAPREVSTTPRDVLRT